MWRLIFGRMVRMSKRRSGARLKYILYIVLLIDKFRINFQRQSDVIFSLEKEAWKS